MQNSQTSVAHFLQRMSGVWHDVVEVYDLAGNRMTYDEYGGVPGAVPYENLVYIECDGVNYRQTNVTFRGRPIYIRSFAAQIIDGVLVFNKLGPQAPEHIGISGGPNCVIYTPRHVDEAWQRYSEPDVLYLFDDDHRMRVTFLYRHGEMRRSLRATGTRIAATADKRVALDPRGLDGPVHNLPSVTTVFQKGEG